MGLKLWRWTEADRTRPERRIKPILQAGFQGGGGGVMQVSGACLSPCRAVASQPPQFLICPEKALIPLWP